MSIFRIVKISYLFAFSFLYALSSHALGVTLQEELSVDGNIDLFISMLGAVSGGLFQSLLGVNELKYSSMNPIAKLSKAALASSFTGGLVFMSTEPHSFYPLDSSLKQIVLTTLCATFSNEILETVKTVIISRIKKLG